MGDKYIRVYRSTDVDYDTRDLLQAVLCSKIQENQLLFDQSCHKFPIPRVIMIRAAYRRMLEIIFKILEFEDNSEKELDLKVIERNAIEVFGTPGVGKTLFCLYAIRCLLDMKRISILYEAQLTDLKAGSCLLWFCGGQYELVDDQRQIDQLVKGQGLPVVYIVDGKAPGSYVARVNVTPILVGSPRSQYFERFHKNINLRKLRTLYMPLWSLSELLESQKLLSVEERQDFEIESEDAVIRRYEMLGGVARSVLSDLFNTHLKDAIRKIQNSDPDSLLYALNDISHQLVHIHVDDNSLDIRGCGFPSIYITRLVLEKYYATSSKTLKEIVTRFAPRSNLDIDLDQYKRRFCFELLCMVRLTVSGNQSAKNSLVLAGKSLCEFEVRSEMLATDKIRVQCCSDQYPFFYNNSGLRKLRDYSGMAQLKQNNIDQFLFACKKNFPTIDAFSVNNGSVSLFQFTQYTNHPISVTDEFVELVNNIIQARADQNLTFALIWLVPTSILDKFQAQSFTDSTPSHNKSFFKQKIKYQFAFGFDMETNVTCNEEALEVMNALEPVETPQQLIDLI